MVARNKDAAVKAELADKVAANTAPKTRVMSTPEERIAKLEADLASAIARKDAKENKGTTLLLAKRTAIFARIAKLKVQVDAIDAQLPADAEDIEV